MPNFLRTLEKFLPQREKKPEYFLALELRKEKIKAAIWENKEGRVEILSIGSQNYSGDIKEAISAADKVIGEVENILPPQSPEVKKVIFGIPENWVKDNKIEPPNLLDLKKLSSELFLKPLGFVVTTEAIISFLQKQEGIPPTLILLGAETDEITVSLVKVGRIEGTKKEEVKEENWGESLESALKSFSGIEILPSRILLYNDSADLEKIKQSLISYPFLPKLPFLHFPKIEILEENTDIKSLVAAVGTEMGMEFEAIVPPLIPKEEGPEEENLGFIKGEDIKKKEEEKVPEKEEIKRKFKLSFKLPHFRFPSFSFPSFDFHFDFGQKMKWILLIFLLILFIGGGGLFSAYWYLPSATVTLLVEPKILEKEAEIMAVSDLGAPDFANKQIPAGFLEIEETAKKTTVTTGKKTVGEPGRGEVTIYNKTTNSKTFKSGTVLLGSSDLKFSLDEEVTVASASDTGVSLEYGKGKGKVTASLIGSKGNLSSGTSFSFVDFPSSSYSAKNEQDFSGGFSREIAVVSKADQERLIASLSAELKEKAKKDLEAKISPGERIVEKALEGNFTQKKFDKKIDEEGNELALEGKMNFKSLTYKEDDLKQLMEKMVQESIAEGYELREKEIEINVFSVEKKKEGVLLGVHFKANLSPKFPEVEIKKNLLGKYPRVTEDYLRSLPNVSSYEFSLSPRFPKRIATFPRFPQKIKIEVITR